MTEALEALARQAAAGNEMASWFLFCRLAKVLELLDPDSLARIANHLTSLQQNRPAPVAPSSNGTLEEALRSRPLQTNDCDLKSGLTPEMIQKARDELTPEVLEALKLEIEDLREHGGYQIDDLLQEFERASPTIMTSPSEVPARYHVAYSGRVRSAVRDLLTQADACGLGQYVRDAIKEIDRRLRIYPQFGEPHQDLAIEGQTLWIGTVWPVVLRYVLDEPRRTVLVLRPFQPYAHLGL